MRNEKNNSVERIYCSLDIETSGFDPLKNEVLEVGLAFFVVTDSGLQITEEWTKVFKPEHEVPAQILALTGITKAELERAEPFEDSRSELQEKLRTAVIVGHNVQFDMNFLKSLGIEFSGEAVDTLDLVQFILPTHHSYNLENLMHLFQVSHKDAHRALADAKASLIVLEKLLGVYSGFTPELRDELQQLAEQAGYFYADLLTTVFPVYEIAQKAEVLKNENDTVRAHMSPGHIYNVPIGGNCVEIAVASLREQKQKSLLVVPKISQVVQLWKAGSVRPVVSAENSFDEKKFTAFRKRKEISTDETKFIMKVLVWQATNWQRLSLHDLNLSFFGGQFKRLIASGTITKDAAAPVLCCDLETLNALIKQKFYGNRLVVIVGLSEFEQFVSGSLSIKASWSYITYILKTLYNPETETGNPKLVEAVVEGLNKSDLFFGLVHALLSSEGQVFEYKKIEESSLQTESFEKVRLAAEHFTEGLLVLNEQLQSEEIGKFSENVSRFFQPQTDSVQWVELAQSRCVLYSSPLDIRKPVRAVLGNFEHTAFLDTFSSLKLGEYLIQRLGLDDFVLESLAVRSKPEKTQGDLFQVLLSKISLQVGKKVSCHITPRLLGHEELMGLLLKANLPAAVLFGNTSQVKEFQDLYYEQLKQRAFLLTQNSSGGSNKIFHNFSIHGNSLLLATGKLILKHLAGSVNTNPVEHLSVKTLIVCNLPFESFKHPYQEAVSARLSNPFEDYSLPKAVYNFHMLLNFFYTRELEQVYVCDSKLAKNYAGAFREYIGQIPNLEVVA